MSCAELQRAEQERDALQSEHAQLLAEVQELREAQTRATKLQSSYLDAKVLLCCLLAAQCPSPFVVQYTALAAQQLSACQLL